MADCTCGGEQFPDGERVVTVGCRVHHLMEDGSPAADHEVLCMCGNFADDRECVLYVSAEETAEYGDGEPFHVCAECIGWCDKQPHLGPAPPSTRASGEGE